MGKKDEEDREGVMRYIYTAITVKAHSPTDSQMLDAVDKLRAMRPSRVRRRTSIRSERILRTRSNEERAVGEEIFGNRIHSAAELEASQPCVL